jgi:ADP-ribose pyrophosphatase
MSESPGAPGAPRDAPEHWPLEGSTVEREYSIFAVRRDRVRSPRTGKLHDFVVLRTADAVAVIAVTPGRELVLVEQFRHGIRENTLELPGGILEDDDPLATAASELREETGYAGAEPVLLGTLDLNPSWQTTRVHFVLIDRAVPAGAKDEDEGEDTRVRLVPLADAHRLVRHGEIRNVVAVAGLGLLEPL